MRMPIPVVDGVTETPAGPPPMMALLSKLMEPEGGEVGSAGMARDILSRLEQWARKDRSMAPMISDVMDMIENASSPSSPDREGPGPKAGDALGGTGELKTPV